jgi:hypothetical protein
MASTERASMAGVGYARPIAMALRRPALAIAALRMAVEALRSFFLPQFENALFRRRRVVNVDHPLDGSVPFDPGYVKKYLEFVKLWMGSFYTLGRLYGDDAVPSLVAYVDAIRSLYADAGKIYKKVHTTTTRPSKNYNLRFAVIHAADPHLNCIPSLHVLVVVANWRLALGVARDLGGAESLGPWIEGLRREAVAITDSVLFVKQHSVNCIGASLFYLRRRGPDFGEAELEGFVRDLFSASPSAEALRARVLEVFEGMDRSYAERPQLGWQAPIVEFIEGCAR